MFVTFGSVVYLLSPFWPSVSWQILLGSHTHTPSDVSTSSVCKSHRIELRSAGGEAELCGAQIAGGHVMERCAFQKGGKKLQAKTTRPH